MWIVIFFRILMVSYILCSDYSFDLILTKVKTYLYSSVQKDLVVFHETTWNATQFYVYHIDHKPHIIMKHCSKIMILKWWSTELGYWGVNSLKFHDMVLFLLQLIYFIIHWYILADVRWLLVWVTLGELAVLIHHATPFHIKMRIVDMQIGPERRWKHQSYNSDGRLSSECYCQTYI